MGAAKPLYQLQPGATPQEINYKNNRALKARPQLDSAWFAIHGLNRAFSSFHFLLRSWGVAPGYN